MTTTNTALAISNDSELASSTFPKAQLTESVWVDWAAFRNCMKAALVTCSDDESRIALNSILVEVDQRMIRLVSTDGHRCMTVSLALPISTPTENRDTFSFQISREDAIAFTKNAPSKKAMTFPLQAEIRLNGRDLTIATSSGTMNFQTVYDAQFPPYDQVIPKLHLTEARRNKERRSVSLAVCVNATYLADLGTIAKLTANPRANGVAIEVGENELDPIRCDISNSDQGIEVVYVVMPTSI